MDPVELLDQLERRVNDNIAAMGAALADGVCMNNSNPERAYANCVGRVEGWKHVLADIDDIKRLYIDE